MKKIAIVGVFVLLAGVGTGAYLAFGRTPVQPQVAQSAITRGDLAEGVIATGALTPTRTVDIGSQVGGVVTHLYVDFNSLVHKGQVLAQIDPGPSQADLDSAQASLEEANITLRGHQENYASDEKTFEREDSLYKGTLVPLSDFEAAELQVKGDQAQIKEDQAAVAVAQAGVTQAQVNLQNCTITSPVDGVVISRAVDEGQAVAARMSAPTLYSLATELTSLLLIADVDESDIARVRAGQDVAFTVDAFPTTEFHGKVMSARLNATNTNNVVTYQVVISTANPDLRLLPGMTASINILTARAPQVLRVSNQALQFRPSPVMLEAFGVKGDALQAALKSEAAKADVLKPVIKSAPSHVLDSATGTIDTFYAPMVKSESTGQVWTITDSVLQSHQVRLGLTDGRQSELLSADVPEGAMVVTSIIMPKTTR